MKIRIEAALNLEQKAQAAQVRREVFRTECVEELCRLAPTRLSRGRQLIARLVPEGRVVATLTVVETTGDRALHAKNGLSFGNSDRVARYTQMAVMPSHRGLNLPLYLLLEARRLYIEAGGLTHTWLLMPAGRAATSKLSTMLDFSASQQTVAGDQGPSRVLLRDETASAALFADMRTRSFLEAVCPRDLEIFASCQPSVMASHHLVREDEWVAQ